VSAIFRGAISELSASHFVSVGASTLADMYAFLVGA
jgi:hypothetical protein